MTRLSYDALVLAGGRARRLGGASKPDVLVAGRRLLSHVLGAVQGPEVRRVVVVGPDTLEVPPGISHTLEEPPDGGPVAGIAAGLAALRDGAEAAWVIVLACDLPRVAGAVPRLVRAVAALGPDTGGQNGADGVLLVDDDGWDQPLVGLYRRAALESALARLAGPGPMRSSGPLALRGMSVRELVGSLTLARLADPERHGLDVDTWSDLEALGAGRSDAVGHARGTMTGRADSRPDEMPAALPDTEGAA